MAKLATLTKEPETATTPDVRLDALMRAKDDMEKSSWSFALQVWAARKDALYTEWGFNTWREFVDAKLGMKDRSIAYFIALAKWHDELSPKNKKWAESLSWSNAKELTGVVTNDNVAEWKRKVKDKSVKELQDLVLEHRNPGGEEAGETAGAEDGEAEPKERAHTRKFKLFDAQEELVARALVHAKEVAQSGKEGHCLELICADYLATNAGVDDMPTYLARIEEVTGLRLMAIQVASGDHKPGLVYGSDCVDLLMQVESDDGDEAADEEPEAANDVAAAT